jgi:hypothetical protein
MRNIIESGMIYTFFSIFTLATYVLKSNLSYPASDMVSSLMNFERLVENLSHAVVQEIHSVGITFNLILIRAVHARTETSRIVCQDGTSMPLHLIAPGTVGDSAATVGDNEGVFRFPPFDKEGNSMHAEAV